MALTEAQKARAKEYRERLMAYAKQGGYVPKKREGYGLTIKKTSKHGTTYYYQPWNTLSDEQKAKRIEYSKEYAAKVRKDAAAYRREHEVQTPRRKSK